VFDKKFNNKVSKFMNPENPYADKPKGPIANIDYLIVNGIERNPVIEREINPDKKIPRGLPVPDISTRASLEFLLDNNIDFNPVFESKLRKPNVTSSGEDLDEILSQYIEGYDINDYIKSENSGYDNGEEDKDENHSPLHGLSGVIALPPAPESPAPVVEDDEVIIEDDSNDLPPILVHDDEESDIIDLADEPVLLPAEESEESENNSKRFTRRQKVVAAALAALATGALLFGLNRSDSDSIEGGYEPTTTEVEVNR
jgi:hypothetical protein